MSLSYGSFETILLPIAILEFVIVLDLLEVGLVATGVCAHLLFLWYLVLY